MNYDKNLYGQELTKEDELKIIYEGPSFENRIEINDLSEQLEALDVLIRGLADELASKKIIAYDSGNLNIYVSVKQGSFEQYISIIFTNPEFRGYIVNGFVFLLGFFLTKKSEEKIIKKIEHQQEMEIIKNLVRNQSVRKIKSIHEPLKQEYDTAKFIYNEEELLRINFEDKENIDKKIIEEEDKIETEETDEEMLGYLSSVNIDSNKKIFHILPSDIHVQAIFNIGLDEIKDILGKKIKIKAKVYKKFDKIEKIKIISYEEPKERTINDY